MSAYRMPLSDFRRSAFRGRAPCAATLRKAIIRGELPGERIGARFFVLVDESGQLYKNAAQQSHQVQASTGDADADQLLLDWMNDGT